MSRHKYPRTYHLPFSPGATSDDKVLSSLAPWHGQEVVVTLKMDGENTSLYANGFHARSLDSRHHPSRDWVAQFHARFAHEIPSGWRICGENLYARHSLAYDDLPSYFLGFSVWDEHNHCLSWDDSLMVFQQLGIVPVPTLWRGLFDPAVLERLTKTLDTRVQEGVVMRVTQGFAYADFSQAVAKWVRPTHVQTNAHWMQGPIIPNGLQIPTHQ
jgi:hypothetical protein